MPLPVLSPQSPERGSRSILSPGLVVGDTAYIVDFLVPKVIDFRTLQNYYDICRPSNFMVNVLQHQIKYKY